MKQTVPPHLEQLENDRAALLSMHDEMRRQIDTLKEDQRVSAEAYNFLHEQYRDVRDACHKTLVFMNAVNLQDTAINVGGEMVDVRQLLRQVLNRTMELPKR